MGRRDDVDAPVEGNGFFDEPDDTGLDFTDFMREAGLQDLSWLEMVEQDPERLPKNTEMDTAIPELEEAWGVERRTEPAGRGAESS